MQSHTRWICWTFLDGVFSNVSSQFLHSVEAHEVATMIAFNLLFLSAFSYVEPKFWSETIQSHTVTFAWLWGFKCLVKLVNFAICAIRLSTQMPSLWILHLCVFKCSAKLNYFWHFFTNVVSFPLWVGMYLTKWFVSRDTNVLLLPTVYQQMPLHIFIASKWCIVLCFKVLFLLHW